TPAGFLPRSAASSIRHADAVAPAEVRSPLQDNQAVMKVQRSKCLSQGDEVLCRFDARRRIQVVADVHTHWPNRSCIAETNSKRIRVLAMKTDRLEDVTAVVKGNHAQPALQRYRNAEFRIDDQQLVSTTRHIRVAGRIYRWIAEANRLLRPRTV